MAKLPVLITRIDIDAGAERKNYLVQAKQGDKATRFVSVLIVEDGKEYAPPADADLIANFQKPDGKFAYNAAKIDEGNRILVELTNQVLAVPGEVVCEVEIRAKDGSQVLTSCTFTIKVGRSNRNENEILSSNEMTAFDTKWAEINTDMEEWATAERLRAEAETAREEAESDRAAAEDKRRTDIQAAIGETEAAAEAANNAAKRVEAAAGSLQPEVEKLKDDIAGLKDSKQDKLIAGTGITIAEDGKTISASGGEILIAHKVWADCYIELTPVEIDYENYTITVADASGVPLEISGNCVDYISITDWSGKNATLDIAPVELFPVQLFAIHVGDNRLQFYNSKKTLIQFTANDNVDINRFKIYVKKQNATRLSVTNLYQNHAYRIVMVKRGFNHFVSGFSINNSNNRNWGYSYGSNGGVKSFGLGSNAGNSFNSTSVNLYETFSFRGIHYADTVMCSFFPSIIDVEIVPSKNGNVFEHWLHWRMSYVQRGSSTVKEIQYRYTTGTLFMPYEIGSIVSNFGNAGNYFGNGTEMLVFDKGEWVE